MQWTYAKAGVDIKKEQNVVKALSAELTRGKIRKSFSGLLELPFDTQHPNGIPSV
jgi:phosphoribosylaminoimidazole (AIR) synthetase